MSDAIVSALVGGLAGFLTSFYFWRKSQRKDRPRLYVKVRDIDQDSGEANFEIENEGDTHAINIMLDDVPFPDKPTDLAPKSKFDFEVLSVDESKEYVLSYFDVWGTKYEAKWYLSGPHRFDLEAEDWIYDYAAATKAYEFQGGSLILKARKLFKKYI